MLISPFRVSSSPSTSTPTTRVHLDSKPINPNKMYTYYSKCEQGREYQMKMHIYKSHTKDEPRKIVFNYIHICTQKVIYRKCTQKSHIYFQSHTKRDTNHPTSGRYETQYTHEHSDSKNLVSQPNNKRN